MLSLFFLPLGERKKGLRLFDGVLLVCEESAVSSPGHGGEQEQHGEYLETPEEHVQ